jgi:hypothetical protein
LEKFKRFFSNGRIFFCFVESYCSDSARIGQKLTHLPHRMHFVMSTLGAALPLWLSAPTGQTRIDGQAWFWGQRIVLTDRFFSPAPEPAEFNDRGVPKDIVCTPRQVLMCTL